MLLAADQALKTSGIAIFDEEDLVVCGSWTIPSKEKELSNRINQFLLFIESFCKIYPIDKIVFEDTQQQFNITTFKHLNYLEGNLEYWCYQNGYDYDIMAPSHWRKVLSDKYNIKFGRKRAEQKQVAMDLLSKIYNIKDVSSDSADAVCIGLANIIESKSNESAFI